MSYKESYELQGQEEFYNNLNKSESMNTVQEVLDASRIDGNNVYLPDVQLERKLYTDVNKKLTGIGGKWNRKAKAHVFSSDPTELMGRVLNGEKINLKKDFQFFETPQELADQLVEHAEIESHHHVLEPSAGQGAIIEAIIRAHGYMNISAIELMQQNIDFLNQQAFGEIKIMGGDFLDYSPYYKLDRIVANPPFTKNQDIDHIRHMYDCLKHGGRLVSVASQHWALGTEQKCQDFRHFLSLVDANVLDIDRGTFQASGTMVGGHIIIIDKI